MRLELEERKPVISDEVYSRLMWSRIDPNQLAEMMIGATIIDVHPIDYPNTDGYDVTIRRDDGSIHIFDFDYTEGDKYEWIVVKHAEVK